MNHRQLELVRSSYERIRRVRTLFADLFNRRLTLIAPVFDRLLPEDPDQRDEAFLELVEQVVVGLDRLDELLPALVAQARAWRRRGVDPADYDVAGAALSWTMEQVLAGSPGAIDAWCQTFELLAGVMKRAVEDGGLPRSYGAVPPPPPDEPDLPVLSRRAHTPTAAHVGQARLPALSESTPRLLRVPLLSEQRPKAGNIRPSF